MEAYLIDEGVDGADAGPAVGERLTGMDLLALVHEASGRQGQ